MAGPAGLAGLALLGAGLVLARQMEFGAGLNYDSADYIHVARQMQAGAPWHWRSHRGEGLFVHQPPLYPAMLAVASGGVLDPLDVAGPLNAALFGGMVLLCGAFLRRRLAARPLWGWCGCAAIVLSPPLVLWASTAMPETLFVLFAMGALILVAEKDPPTGRLAFATALTSLACLTRHAGGALVVVVSAMLLLASDLHWAKRLRRAAAYAILASAPSGLWLLLVRPPIEHHETDAVLSMLAFLGNHMATWVFLELPTTWFGTGWGALLASAALFSICVAALRKRLIWRPLVVFSGYVVANLVFLLIAAELGSFVAMQRRYLVPSFVPCLFVAWLVVGELLGARAPATTGQPMRRRLRRVALTGALVVLLTLMVAPWLAYQAVMHKSAIVERNLRGFDFDSSRWRDSEALRYLRQHHAPNSRVYAYKDYTPAVYLHTGVVPFTFTCNVRNPRDGDYLLWLQVTPDPCAGQDLTYSRYATHGLDPVADFADGVLLRFNAASTGTLADAVWAHLVPNGGPVSSAPWALHLDPERRQLVFAKAPCTTEDVATRIFLHAYSNGLLPAHRRQFGFDNLDFDFSQRGLILPAGEKSRCVAVVELPRYPLTSLRAGQFAQQELWAVRVDFDSDDGRSALRWSSPSRGR